MDEIIWKPEYSLNIVVIDEQHKKFVALLDELSIAIAKAEVKETLDKVLKELDAYMNFHFSTEESYFEKFDYVDAKEHIEAHNDFRKKVAEIRSNYEHDELRLSFELVSYLADWLVNHLNGMDKKYVECFKSHGLK